MISQGTNSESAANLRADFLPTRWSMVLAAAGQPAAAETAVALEQLAKAYWQPVYAFIRRQTASASDAEDLTQEFFARLLEKRFLNTVDPERGKFRSFLLTAVKHFMSNQSDQSKAQKRGGKVRIISIAHKDGDLDNLPAQGLSPDQVFARQWALSVLDQVIKALRQEYQQRGKLAVFEALKDSLAGSKGSQFTAEAGKALEFSAGATRVAMHRLRRRYREILRQHIAQTVADSAEVDGEIQFLIQSL